ncbi:MAG TPA: hypothetical protein DCR97_02775 [Deltaproteobacteria bacterium]|nr:hypothetical protein [Deltaproteobacteria bacterium]
MREVIDEVDPEEITPLFDDFFRPLQRGKHLEQYSVSGRYIAAIDGSQYFTSEKISCPGCLIKEGKRLLGRLRKPHPKLSFIIVADGLCSKQPAIEEVLALRMDYVLVAKSDDHEMLMEWVNEQRALKEVTRWEVREKDRTRIYEWVNVGPYAGLPFCLHIP